MTRRLLLLGFLVCFVCCFALRAHAQSVGGSCSTAGSLVLTGNSSPGELLYCSGSAWGLAFAITSGGLVGLGTATPNSGAVLDLGSANTNSMLLPSGTSAQRPTGTAGMIRYNSTVPQIEAYYSGAWQALGGGGSSTITLGTSASATNPQRSGQAGTGLFSATTNIVSIAENGTDVADFISTGLNLPGATLSYQLNGNNAVWLDHTNANLAVGDTALPSNISQSGGGNNGAYDVAVGQKALNANTTGYENTAVGASALQTNTTGIANTAMGYQALYSNTAGIDNTAVGTVALYHNTTGSYNTAVGDNALQPNTSGNQNSALGFQALSSNTTGGNNTAMGYNALLNNTTGVSNTAVGDDALAAVTTGSSNTAIGQGVAFTTLKTGSNNILIGTSSAVDVPSDPTSNFLNIGNVIFATGMTGTVSSPAGNVGIGTASPSAMLNVLNASGSSTTELRVEDTSNSDEAIMKIVGGTAGVGELLYTGNSWGGIDGTNALEIVNTLDTPIMFCLGGSCAGGGNAMMTIAYHSGPTIGINTMSPNSGAALDLGSNTNSMLLPSGTSAQRPTGANGMLRYNSTVPQVEAYYSGAWQALGGGGSTTITLGTSASATNPQRSGQAGTGLFSATTNIVSIAENGTDVADFASNGLDLPVTSESYQIDGIGVLQFPYAGVDNSSIAVGQGALNGQVDNNKLNVGIGYYANQANGYGYNDTIVGAYAGYNNGGNNDTVIGESALFNGGSYDVAVGQGALNGSGGASNGTAVGYQALTNVSGTNNTALGYEVGSTTLTTGTDNILIGVDNTTDTYSASSSTVIGIGQGVKPGTNDIAIGYQALHSSAGDSQYNTAVGYQALKANTTGTNNIAIGATALPANTIGHDNIALGYQAMQVNTNGYQNIAIGSGALAANNANTADNNIAIGSSALSYNNTGQNNLAIGSTTARFNMGGENNVAIGPGALYYNQAGNNNTVLGYGVAGTTLNGGSSNILIGTSTATDTPAAGTSNFLNIGNVIFATGMTGSLSAPAGYVGIGTASPQAQLHVLGGGGVGSPAPSFGSSDLVVIQNNAAEYANVNLDLVSDFFGSSSIQFDGYGTGASGNANISYASQYGQLRFNFGGGLAMVLGVSGSNFYLEIGAAGGACGSEMLAICPQNGSETNDYFSISSSSDGDTFMVKKSGKVGIGTATPRTALDLGTSGVVLAGNSVYLTATNTDSTAATQESTGLVLPTIPGSTIVSGHCTVIWEKSAGPGTTTFAIVTSAAPTDLWVVSNTLLSTATASAPTYTTITTAATTNVTGAITASATSAAQVTYLTFTLSTAASTPVTLTIDGNTSVAADHLLTEPGSLCGWDP